MATIKKVKSKKNLTTYEAWNKGIVGGFGSFHTSLLQTYRLADGNNRKNLEKGFKDWFVAKVY